MKLAMVFPGQGSQAIGMFDAYGDSPVVREVLQTGCDVLKQDMAALVREGPAEELSKTTNTQPLMVMAGIATFRLWQSLGGPMPIAVAGHSLGEYTALVAAGSLPYEECLPLVRLRAQAMQEAVPQGEGAMAAILGLDDDAVRAACIEGAQGQVVEAVNFNAPSQVVIAGHAQAVQRASEIAKNKGAKRAVLLPVSAPFHSSLMGPAARRLKDYLDQVNIRLPAVPIVHNVDALERDTVAGIRQALVDQADRPVRWVDCMRRIAALGAQMVAECGPGKVLAPMAKRIDERLAGVALVDRKSVEETIAKLRGES